jgi:Xaa-Pro aminopeptidase
MRPLWQIAGVNTLDPPHARPPLPLVWPRSTAPAALAARRRKLRERVSGSLVIASGWARARNFPHNVYPFRAESHFLYLVGRPIEGAALVLDDAGEFLYLPADDPGARLWHGPEPTADDWARELGIEVRSIESLGALPGAATLPPQDPTAAAWLSSRLGRPVVAGSGDRLAPEDVPLAEAMIALRLVHDAAALEQLRQAALVTTRAHLAGLRATQPGLREAQVAAAMQAEIVAHGMTCSYEPIVTAHGEVLHVRHKHGVLEPHDLLLADVGAETPEGWAADVTRTWPVSGRFSPTQRDMYDAVLTAQAAALAKVVAGARYRDVHLASQRALLECLLGLGILRGSPEQLAEQHASALFYPHGVGHLLGLDVHDMEDLGDRAGYAPGHSRQPDATSRFLRLDRELQAGMVVTIEPGFYQIPDLIGRIEPGSVLDRALDRERLAQFSDVRGIRIEDDVLVTTAGYEILSQDVPRTVRDIEAAMRSGPG